MDEIFKKYNVEVIWVSNDYNKRYLTNFSGSASEVILTPNEIILLTDGRYQTQVKKEVFEHIQIEIINSSVDYENALKKKLIPFKRIGFEGNNVTINQLNSLEKLLSNSEFIPINNEIEQLRLLKNEDEIEKIKTAVKITDQTFSYVCENIKVGMTEKEVQVMVDSQLILLGADKTSFDTICVSGSNTAKPHGQASNKVIKSGDIVTLDFGCYKDGYVSDMTRTFFVGEVGSSELVKIHNLVNYAAKEQIKAIKPGVRNIDIDKIAREIFKKENMEQYFIHGTGHGIGLEIHENPYVNKSDETILVSGMAITIEPGLYIEGIGGVRIEQDIIVTNGGCIELNSSNKEYDAAIK